MAKGVGIQVVNLTYRGASDMNDKGVGLKPPADPSEAIVVGRPFFGLQNIRFGAHEITDTPPITVRFRLASQGILGCDERTVGSAGNI
jgi:hypothetical protein